MTRKARVLGPWRRVLRRRLSIAERMLESLECGHVIQQRKPLLAAQRRCRFCADAAARGEK